MSRALPISASLLRRSVPTLLGLVLVAAMASVYWAGFMHAYAYLLHVMGAYYSDTPFMDTQFELASMECVRLGIDVFVSNPCDMLGRLFNYSPIWLLGAHLPLHPSQTLAFGLTLDVLFLLSLVLLPPARSWWGALVTVAATLSNSVFLALEQANADLIMFILLLLAGIAALRPLPVRFVAYPLIVAAGLLKFYPMVAMVIALRERPSRFLLVAAFAVLCVAVLVYADGADIARAMRLVPSGHNLSMFGADVLPYGLRSLYPRANSMLPLSPAAFQLILSSLTVILAIAIATRRQIADAIAQLSEPERVFLLLGSLILVGCFFAGQSFRYRNVFFLFVLPAMTAMWFTAHTHFTARLFAISSGCIVFLVWGYYLARMLESVMVMTTGSSPLGRLVTAAFWLGHQLVWWWIISVMLATILLIASRCQAVRIAINYLPDRRG